MKKLLFLLVMAALGGCYWDNEEDLYPEGSPNCDTTSVTFSGTVFPIIQNNCISCHGGTAPSGNIPLENHTDISKQASIAVGQAGSLYGAITHAAGNSPMPRNGTPLPDCQVKQIKAWIDAGTPNN
jgi:hypothetical protein